MLNSPLPDRVASDQHVDRVVAEGPHGAVALAVVSTAIVIAIWFAFYLFVFLPRGPLE
jgi:hypothetical protein